MNRTKDLKICITKYLICVGTWHRVFFLDSFAHAKNNRWHAKFVPLRPFANFIPWSIFGDISSLYWHRFLYLKKIGETYRIIRSCELEMPRIYAKNMYKCLIYRIFFDKMIQLNNLSTVVHFYILKICCILVVVM